ncbi:MAG: hypothetical protein RL033_5384 [Pseudomonadota bacterium]|jgi:hypothetical protein
MIAFVQACQDSPLQARLRRLLQLIVSDAALHARFLNSLARLEYVGVRKMIKARRSQDLDLDGLQHLLEEAVHATRLKKFARSVAPDSVCVDTFRAEHTLAGDEAEAYFQAVDQAGAVALGREDGEASYALTSAAIEIRARTFYPAYQEVLEAAGSRISVQSILNDEEAHLDEMQERLQSGQPEWRTQLEQVMLVEQRAFSGLLDAFDAAVTSHR